MIKNTLRFCRDQYYETVSPKLRPLDTRASARLYGNSAGTQTNLSGDLAELKCRVLSDGVRTNGHSDGAADHLRGHGYAELDEIYDSGLIERIQERFDTVIEDDQYSSVRHREDPGDGNEYIRGLDDPLAAVPEFVELVNDYVRSTLNEYYDAHFQIRTARAYRTHHIPEEIVESTDIYNDYWHFDGKTPDHVKLFITLSDTTEADGPLHLMPKEGTEQISRVVPEYNRYEHGVPGGTVDELGDAVTLTGPAGTAMLGNTQCCLHRAGIPEEGNTRDLVQFYIAPATEPWPEDWGTTDVPHSTSSGGLTRPFRY